MKFIGSSEKFLSRRAFLIALILLSIEIGLLVTLFTGLFVRSVRYQRIDSKHWYYISRGYPFTHSGISLNDRSTEWPIVKIPFSSHQLYGYVSPEKYVKKGPWFSKAVHLPYFLLAWMLYSIAGVIVAFPISILAINVRSQKLNWKMLMILYLALFPAFYIIGGIWLSRP